MPRRVPMFRPRRASDAMPAPARPDDRPSSTARGYGSAAWQRVRQAVIARDGGICRLCGLLCTIAPGDCHVDHIDPKARDEAAEATPLEGLRLLCRKCHSKHGRKWTPTRRDGGASADGPEGV